MNERIRVRVAAGGEWMNGIFAPKSGKDKYHRINSIE